MSQVQCEMPRYQCHKKVWAIKIKEIEHDSTNGSAKIVPADDGYESFVIPAEFVQKHSPEEGGYIVYYPGGYKSFSPAKAFEEWYSKI